MAPPVSDTRYVPLHAPAFITTFEPSFKTLGSAAIRPRRTPCPIAVRPEKQYAVAENAPRLAPAPVAFDEPVFVTNFLSSVSSVKTAPTSSLLLIVLSVLVCESVAIMRASSCLVVWAYTTKTTARLNSAAIAPPLTILIILLSPFERLRLNAKIVSEIWGHQPLFASNEDCFGELISTCSVTLGRVGLIGILAILIRGGKPPCDRNSLYSGQLLLFQQLASGIFFRFW